MRKTFHHLSVGDHVVVELFWDDMVSSQYAPAKVVEVGRQRMKILFATRPGHTETLSFSRQGGQEWGGAGLYWRIAPAHARVKGAPPKPYTPPKGLLAFRQLARRRHFVYPGQPLVCAAAIVALFPSPEAAAVRPAAIRAAADPSKGVSLVGGQMARTVAVLLTYRHHQSIDRVIAELHAGWRDTAPVAPVKPTDGLGKQAATVLQDAEFVQGQTKAEALEPMLRAALTVWFTRRS